MNVLQIHFSKISEAGYVKELGGEVEVDREVSYSVINNSNWITLWLMTTRRQPKQGDTPIKVGASAGKFKKLKNKKNSVYDLIITLLFKN